jgi:hypothetical protein
MKKIHLVLSGIIVLSLIASVVAIALNKQTSPSPPQTLQECNVLTDNGPDSTGILFFSTKETAQKYADYFLSTSPFKEFPQHFSFYYLDESQFKPECELYKGIALYCYNKDVIKAAGACPYDYIVVLQPSPKSIRSSAFERVMSLNVNHPLSVFAHEYGHVFDKVNFAEEYNAEGARIPRSSKNCQENCNEFTQTSSEFGCYEECSKSNYFREFENGFMRTLSASRYGNYDEELIRQGIQKEITESKKKITGLASYSPEDCANQQYYLIQGTSEDNKINIESKELVQGCAAKPITSGKFDYAILSDNDKISVGTAAQEQIFVTEAPENEDNTINSPPLEPDNSFILTIPASSTESPQALEITDQQNNPLAQIQLNEIGASPCQI